MYTTVPVLESTCFLSLPVYILVSWISRCLFQLPRSAGLGDLSAPPIVRKIQRPTCANLTTQTRLHRPQHNHFDEKMILWASKPKKLWVSGKDHHAWAPCRFVWGNVHVSTFFSPGGKMYFRRRYRLVPLMQPNLSVPADTFRYFEFYPASNLRGEKNVNFRRATCSHFVFFTWRCHFLRQRFCCKTAPQVECFPQIYCIRYSS